MARKYSTKKRKNKIEPAVQTLSFQLTTSPFEVSTTDYIDLSQVASLVNRRFYRQGINWAVGGFKFLAATGFKGSISVFKLPNTWVMSNAWEKGFRAWQDMNKKALEEAGSVRPRFLDFKIFANFDHASKGVGANLLPYTVDYSGAPAVVHTATPGEWAMSTYNIPDPTAATYGVYEREILATGMSYPGAGASGINSVSLIEGYANSRGLPNVLDPNVPDDAADADGVTPENWMSALFNDGTEQDADTLEDLISENNIAPYPFENDGVNTDTMYPGGETQLPGLQIHSAEFVSATTVGGTTRVKGGNFPCGLIGITQYNQGEGGPFPVILEISLIPGNHRGYLCEPMTEM